MSAPRHQTFRFAHPELDYEQSPGFRLSAQGGLALVHGKSSIRQALLLLLSTTPGERIMRPQYGCDLWRLLFDSNDATTAGLAIHYLRQAIQRWEPRARIVALDAGPHPDRAECLRISLEYEALETAEPGQLTLDVELLGPGA